jgi:two-component system sensor kinase FixL
VHLEFDFAPDMPLVSIDKVQVQQVLLNLLRNAVEAMQSLPRRELKIQTAVASDDTVEISVSDSGPGLAEEVRKRLFLPFTTTKDSGLGVGLSICRSIVEAHGGRLWLADTRGGAEFHFTLPRAAAPHA